MNRTRTARQISRNSPPEPAFGERLWKLTSQVRLRSPVRGVQGQLGRTTIYAMRGETCVIRPYVVPRDPQTALQRRRRTSMGEARKNWSALTENDRQGWRSYALRHLFSPEQVWSEKLAGYSAYVRAQVYRQGMGLPTGSAPPSSAPPGGVLQVEEVAPPDAEVYAFRLRHGTEELKGYRVLFELTPAMPSLRRRPRVKELRWAAEEDAESFLPLGPDGAVYLLPKTRFLVEPGQRYGVRVRIVSEDGVPGEALFADLLRLAPEAGAWAGAETGNGIQEEPHGTSGAAVRAGSRPVPIGPARAIFFRGASGPTRLAPCCHPFLRRDGDREKCREPGKSRRVRAWAAISRTDCPLTGT